MVGVQLSPVDSWFFRDGVPFTSDSAPQENVASLFPPHLPTVVGALRAALARVRGWDGCGRWPREFDPVLGDGPHDLGKMSVDGPFLLRNGRPLFRVPRHLLGVTDENGWRQSTYLRPGKPVESDLGYVRLPDLAVGHPEPGALKPSGDMWLTSAGMNAALKGCLPDDVVPSVCLWASEPRIGMERDDTTRTAAEGMLYSTQHVRPSADVSLGARINGLPEDWNLPPRGMMLLGGESRLAECGEWDGNLEIKAPLERIRRNGKAALIALSPLDLDRETCIGEKPLLGLGARIVSAAMGRPQRIGGWDSLARRPLPIRSVLPPGSVLFCDELSDQDLPDAAEDGLVRVGDRTEWGFGLVALGVWPE